MTPALSGMTAGDDPLSQLERAFITEFLRSQGHDDVSVRALPDDRQRALLKQAAIYASGRLTEVESRARFVDDLHDRDSSSAGHLRGHGV